MRVELFSKFRLMIGDGAEHHQSLLQQQDELFL
jgi:hypothetical protein